MRWPLDLHPSPFRPQPSHRLAFTLAEMLVAMGISALVLAGVAATGGTVQHFRDARHELAVLRTAVGEQFGFVGGVVLISLFALLILTMLLCGHQSADELGLLITVGFTAQMEAELDHVEEGRREWHELLRGFYGPFSQTLERAGREMVNMKAREEPTDLLCDKCQQPMVIPGGERAPGAAPAPDEDRRSPQRSAVRIPAGVAVAYLAPPPGHGAADPRLERFLAALLPALPSVLVYMSTTGVYGDAGGATVDETSLAAPTNDRSRRRLAAERATAAWCGDRGVRSVVLRVPGIYGPHRLPLERLGRGEPALRPEDCGPGNRIHVDDLVSVCIAAATAQAALAWAGVTAPGNCRPMTSAPAATAPDCRKLRVLTATRTRSPSPIRRFRYSPTHSIRSGESRYSSSRSVET